MPACRRWRRGGGGVGIGLGETHTSDPPVKGQKGGVTAVSVLSAMEEKQSAFSTQL